MTCGLEAGTKWAHMWVGIVDVERKKKGLKIQKSVEDLEYSFGRPKRWPGHCGQCLRRFLMEEGGRPHEPDLCKKHNRLLRRVQSG